jgi:hypothetical protein
MRVQKNFTLLSKEKMKKLMYRVMIALLITNECGTLLVAADFTTSLSLQEKWETLPTEKKCPIVEALTEMWEKGKPLPAELSFITADPEQWTATQEACVILESILYGEIEQPTEEPTDNSRDDGLPRPNDEPTEENPDSEETDEIPTDEPSTPDLPTDEPTDDPTEVEDPLDKGEGANDE